MNVKGVEHATPAGNLHVQSHAKKAPIVRLPPKSNVELLLLRSAQVSLILMGLVASHLRAGGRRIHPGAASLGIVIGLMLGPVAPRLERRGLPPGLSASLVVLLFIVAMCLFAVPLRAALVLVARLPQIWADLQHQLSQLKEPLEALKSVRDQLRGLPAAKA